RVLGAGGPNQVEGEDEAVSQAVRGPPDHERTTRGPSRVATRPGTAPTGTSATSALARAFTSTQPRARARGPTVTRTGRPIRAGALNFTPGPRPRGAGT